MSLPHLGLRIALAITLSLLVAVLSNGGNSAVKRAWAAMTVFDPSNLAKNAETAAQTAQMVLSNKGILDTSEDMLSKIGIDGLTTDVASQLFDAAGGAMNAIGHIKKMEGAGRSLMRQMQAGSDGTISVKSIRAGFSLATRYSQDNAPTSGGLGPLHQARARARMETLRTAQTEALGASIYHGQDAVEASTRVQRVAAQAKSAASADGDLRGQLAVLTSAMLMSIEEQTKTRQLLAAYVGQQAIEAQGVGASIQDSSWSNPTSNQRDTSPSSQVFKK